MPLRLGFIGAGGIAERHARAIASVSTAKVSAVFDTDLNKAEAFAVDLGVKSCRSVEQLIDGVDAVYVLTPPRSHRDDVITAIKAGKPVLCEKPISVSLEDARAMVVAAEEPAVAFAVGFNQRCRSRFVG